MTLLHISTGVIGLVNHPVQSTSYMLKIGTAYFFFLHLQNQVLKKGTKEKRADRTFTIGAPGNTLVSVWRQVKGDHVFMFLFERRGRAKCLLFRGECFRSHEVRLKIFMITSAVLCGR